MHEMPKSAGFSLHREALGSDYGSAILRARHLNDHLDAWREGRDSTKSLDTGPRYGSVDWWLETYMRSPAFKKLKERTIGVSDPNETNLTVRVPGALGELLFRIMGSERFLLSHVNFPVGHSLIATVRKPAA